MQFPYGIAEHCLRFGIGSLEIATIVIGFWFHGLPGIVGTPCEGRLFFRLCLRKSKKAQSGMQLFANGHMGERRKWNRRMVFFSSIFPGFFRSHLVNDQANALVVEGIKPQHAVEDAHSLLEPAQPP